MNRIFIGYDVRQIVSYTVLCQSIIDHASEPVSITPLVLETMPIKRQGLTPFTYSRFLVPWLCDFKGTALFLDVDILVRSDVTPLFDNPAHTWWGRAVTVSKNRLKFEWASVMLFNCEHLDNLALTPEYIEKANGLHQIGWTQSIGDLPGEWNRLAEYDEPDPNAKLFHYTSGVPCHAETADLPFADEWLKTAERAMSTEKWSTLMMNSVHAKPVYDRLVREGKIKADPALERAVAS